MPGRTYRPNLIAPAPAYGMYIGSEGLVALPGQLLRKLGCHCLSCDTIVLSVAARIASHT